MWQRLDFHTIIMNMWIYDSFSRDVWVCVHDNLNTIADICFLLGSYVEWRKILADLACQGHKSRSRLFLDCPQSLDWGSVAKDMSCSIRGSEIPSLMTSFLSASLYVSKRGAYWDRLCRDVVGLLVVTRMHCGQTVHPRPIVTIEH